MSANHIEHMIRYLLILVLLWSDPKANGSLLETARAKHAWKRSISNNADKDFAAPAVDMNSQNHQFSPVNNNNQWTSTINPETLATSSTVPSHSPTESSSSDQDKIWLDRLKRLLVSDSLDDEDGMEDKRQLCTSEKEVCLPANYSRFQLPNKGEQTVVSIGK